MRSIPRRRAMAALLAATLLPVPGLLAAPAGAADRSCNGDIGAETVDGDVNVPDGATCGLDGTTVQGDVVLGSGASVVVRGGEITGGIQGDGPGAASVSTEGATVGASIRVSGGSASILSTAVGADLVLTANPGPVAAEGSSVQGTLRADENTGGLTIADNEIGGDLQCTGNDPIPTGGGNTVGGTASGQCAAFAGGGPGPDPDPDPDPGPGGFDDVSASSPHAEAIAWLVEQGITEGCDEDSYCPSVPVTRGQMATFLDRALDLPDGTATFDDVDPGSVHAPGISAVADAGITEGCDEGPNDYCPRDPVTRAQMATFLDRALDLPDGTTTFTDVAPSDVHAPGISAVADAGITEGCDAGGTRYCPRDPVTRAQMASFLFRALAH